MPRVTKQDWGKGKRKRKLRRSERVAIFALGALVIISTVVPALFVGTAPKAAALSATGPDPADFNGLAMTYVLDNSGSVNVVSTSVLVYFVNHDGNTVTIDSAGLNDIPAYDTLNAVADAGAPGTPVTTFQLIDVQSGSILGSCVATKGTDTCPFSNFNFPVKTSMTVNSGYFEAKIVATLTPPPGWVYKNGFSVSLDDAALTGGDIVGLDSKNTPQNFAMQGTIDPADPTPPPVNDWILPFGSDCSVGPSGKIARFTWYDPNNGDPVVQPVKDSFTIVDMSGTPTIVPFTSHGGDDFTTGASPASIASGNAVTPGNNSGTTVWVEFNAQPGEKYQVEWSNVSPTNAMQFQQPFDSIYFLTGGCVATPTVLTPSLNLPSNLEPGLTTTIDALIVNAGGATPPFGMNVKQVSGPAVSGVPVSWSGLSFSGNGGQITKTFTVTVPASTPEGGPPVCFVVTLSDGTASTPYCLGVTKAEHPSVQGFNGDIHAGGGLCLPKTNTLAGLGNSGFVRGNQYSDSYGQFVVSASAPATSINGFGSAGSSGSSVLNLGAAGGYARGCRPDLLAAALDYRAAGLPIQTIVPAPVGTTLFNVGSKSGVFYFDGGDLDISGTVNGTVTIIKTSDVGAVRVAGNITRSVTAYPRKLTPSLGVISAGDIVVAAAVNQVDAYLFSNKKIDTCAEATTGGVAACATAPLTINGFLMANSIAFHRLGPADVKGIVVAEIVNLSPQIYLNPPRFFGFTIEGNLEDGQGERQPLF